MSGGSLSRRVSVQGGGESLSRGVFSIMGSLSRGSLLGDLCPGGLYPGVFIQGGFCLGHLCPGVSLSRGSLCLGGSLSRGVCVRETPLDREPPYSNEWAGRILLECILVLYTLIFKSISQINNRKNFSGPRYLVPMLLI